MRVMILRLLRAKEKHIKEIAEKWRGQITEQVYKALINYKVEITD